jgi:hypothetical protein
VAMQDRLLAQRGGGSAWQDAFYMPTPCDGSVIAGASVEEIFHEGLQPVSTVGCV